MDDDMDSCEMFWSHEMAMRRLLAWLRQSQSHCTDNECVDVDTPANGDGLAFGDNNFFMMTTFVIMAFLLWALRPTSNRRAVDEPIEKQSIVQNHQPRRDGPDEGPSPAVD